MNNSILSIQKILVSILATLVLSSLLISCNIEKQCTDRVHGRVITYSEEEGVPYQSERFLAEGTGEQDVEIILNSNKSTCCPLVNQVTQLDMTTSDWDGYFDFGDRICDGSYRFVSKYDSNFLQDWYQIEQNHNHRHLLLYNHKRVKINFITSQSIFEANEMRYNFAHQNGQTKPFTNHLSSRLSADTLEVSAMPNCNFKIEIDYKGIEQSHLFYSGDLGEDTIIDIKLIE